MPERLFFTSVTVRPPITAVSPSLTRSWLVASCLVKMKPRSAAASGYDRRALGVEVHQDLPVGRHVRRDSKPDTGLRNGHRRARAPGRPRRPSCSR